MSVYVSGCGNLVVNERKIIKKGIGNNTKFCLLFNNLRKFNT